MLLCFPETHTFALLLENVLALPVYCTSALRMKNMLPLLQETERRD